MWNQYRKTLWLTQAFIVIICIGAVVFGKVPALPLLFIFIMMQGAGLLGAAWAWRLKQKIENRTNALPLAKGRA